MDLRSATDLGLLSLVIHITDNKEERFEPSQNLLSIAENGDFGSYLLEHIEVGLKAKTARAANFNNPDNPNTGGLCRGLIDGSIDFLKGSQQLAKGLFDAMDKRSSRGDLAVALFEATLQKATGETRRGRFLALLKLDLSDGFTHAFDPESQTVVPTKQSNSIPTPREGIQKCAFIQGAGAKPGYDLLVRDRQKSKSDVADFFEHRFLDVTPANDSRFLTTDFLDGGLNLLDELASRFDLTNEQWVDIYDTLYEAPKRPEIDVEHLVSELPLNEEMRTFAEAFVDKRFTDRVFVPDASQKRPPRVVYRGDGNLELRIPKDLMVDAFKESKVQGEDGSEMHEIVIRTKKWETKK